MPSGSSNPDQVRYIQARKAQGLAHHDSKLIDDHGDRIISKLLHIHPTGEYSMGTPRLTKCVLVAALLTLPSLGMTAIHNNKTVGYFQAAHSDTDCFWFTLNGVVEADPATPNNPWFAIPRSQYGAKDAYAALLAAKVSGQAVQVTTNGALSCNGYAIATAVIVL